MRRFFILTLVTFAASTVAASEPAEIARQIDTTRTGMSLSEVRSLVSEPPFALRRFLNEGVECLDWSYPTANDRWTTLHFRGGVLSSRTDRTAPAYARSANTAPASDSEAETRQKLNAVTVGMPMADLRALKLTPQVVLASEDLRQALATPGISEMVSAEEKELTAAARALGLDYSAALAEQLKSLAADSVDEAWSFELTGVSLSLLVGRGIVQEIQSVVHPDQAWVERQMLKTLASRKATTEGFTKLKPGMGLLEVLSIVGIPREESSTATADGTVTSLKYSVSRREQYEIEMRDDRVVSVKRTSRY